MNKAPFNIGDIVQFDALYGQDYIKRGHQYGRIEGQHFYDQVDGGWVVDLQKMKLDNGSMIPVGTAMQGVKIYMVPAWAVKAYNTGVQSDAK